MLLTGAVSSFGPTEKITFGIRRWKTAFLCAMTNPGEGDSSLLQMQEIAKIDFNKYLKFSSKSIQKVV